MRKTRPKRIALATGVTATAAVTVYTQTQGAAGAGFLSTRFFATTAVICLVGIAMRISCFEGAGIAVTTAHEKTSCISKSERRSLFIICSTLFLGPCARPLKKRNTDIRQKKRPCLVTIRLRGAVWWKRYMWTFCCLQI